VIVLLSEFIQNCWQQGKVTVASEIISFSAEDIRQSMDALQQYYTHDILELSGRAPQFHATAALWAASWLYRAVQLALLRDAGDEKVNELLMPFDGEITAETIYSVDLCFRYLPDLLGLAKGLAPDDVLVKRLQEAAVQWPFSSVSMPVDVETGIDIILSNDCLCQTYIDRIIASRDIKRSNNELVNERIREALGDHRAALWPGFEPLIKES
jgi:hypothetical protein